MEGPSTLGGYDEEGCEEEDVCRICRMPGEPDSPLYYPCQCNGSIRWVHQDCLLQWLKHSSAISCEVRSALQIMQRSDLLRQPKPLQSVVGKSLFLSAGTPLFHICNEKYPSCLSRACISFGCFRVLDDFTHRCSCYRFWSGLSPQIVSREVFGILP
jgi:hypothetical protein